MTVNLIEGEYEPSHDDTDATPRRVRNPLVVLVVPSGSYRAADFVAAAQALRVDLVVASDGDVPMGDIGRSRSLTVDFRRSNWSASRIANIKPRPDAVIAADDQGVLIAAQASAILGILSNPAAAATATRDKAQMRGMLSGAGVPQPAFRLAWRGSVARQADDIGYPCVVKPRRLSASRGVIRVDNEQEAIVADERIRQIVADAGGDSDEELLVEGFVPGAEVAVEGMIVAGALTVLALLDKPDPLDGPYFEETMFVTPSRHMPDLQEEIVGVVGDAARALGFVSGPVHAELRIGPDGVVLIEVAARPIGGLCGRALTFGLLGESLESVIIRSALGMAGTGLDSGATATGVLMIPIPAAGRLVTIDGGGEALAVEGVTELDQTIANGKIVEPLPEGSRYLGFIFARGVSPDDVEHSLRTAHDLLTIVIETSPGVKASPESC
jgi:formate-dependent phosphoribosylglycinamide formyltransferase (GAR transformylase)